MLFLFLCIRALIISVLLVCQKIDSMRWLSNTGAHSWERWIILPQYHINDWRDQYNTFFIIISSLVFQINNKILMAKVVFNNIESTQSPLYKLLSLIFTIIFVIYVIVGTVNIFLLYKSLYSDFEGDVSNVFKHYRL